MESSEEFEGWLRKGIGRAVLYLKTHNSKPHLEASLHACTHNLAYDSQCESSREQYLKDLIQASGEEEFFRDGLMLVLAAEMIDTDQIDLDQIIAVARMFAERGDAAIKNAMYRAVGRAGFERAGSCYTDLIALDGIHGLVVASERFPATTPDDDLWVVNTLLTALEDRDGSDSANAAIEEASRQRPALKTLVERARRVSGAGVGAGESPRLDYLSLKLAIRKESKFRNLIGWGRTARVEELEMAADDLIEETDRNRLLTYLSIIRRAQFPSSINKVLELAESGDGRISRAAINVLAQISDSRIRELLPKLMYIPERRRDAVELMISNYYEGDFQRIEESLRETRDDADCLHDLGIGVHHLLAVHCPPTAVNSLVLLYENGPCSLCRGEFVEKLIALELIPQWMREECRFDADPDTRKLVQ
jgi:hypothetical protein